MRNKNCYLRTADIEAERKRLRIEIATKIKQRQIDKYNLKIKSTSSGYSKFLKMEIEEKSKEIEILRKELRKITVLLCGRRSSKYNGEHFFDGLTRQKFGKTHRQLNKEELREYNKIMQRKCRERKKNEC